MLRPLRRILVGRLGNYAQQFLPVPFDGLVAEFRYSRQRVNCFRLLTRDLDYRIVLGYPAPRAILLLRQLLSPSAQVAGYLQFFALQLLHATKPLPQLRLIDFVVAGIAHRLQILFDPAVTPAGFQSRIQILVNRQQVTHVVHRVIELVAAQRPAYPVGASMFLFQLNPGNLPHQVGIGNLVIVAEHRGGKLGIENRRRYRGKFLVENFQVLRRRVKNL